MLFSDWFCSTKAAVAKSWVPTAARNSAATHVFPFRASSTSWELRIWRESWSRNLTPLAADWPALRTPPPRPGRPFRGDPPLGPGNRHLAGRLRLPLSPSGWGSPLGAPPPPPNWYYWSVEQAAGLQSETCRQQTPCKRTGGRKKFKKLNAEPRAGDREGESMRGQQ